MQNNQKINLEIKERYKRKALVGIQEISNHLGVKTKTIYAWIHIRQIPYVKVGRLVKFDLADIDAWVQSRKVKMIESSIDMV